LEYCITLLTALNEAELVAEQTLPSQPDGVLVGMFRPKAIS
jgi:hypothetical protein